MNFRRFLQLLLKPEYIFIALALIFGCIFLIKTPIWWGVDESQHFLRAYEISEGKLVSKKISPKIFGDQIPSNIVRLQGIDYALLTSIKVGSVYQRDDFGNQKIKYKQTYFQLIHQQPSRNSEKVAFPGSAAYSPVSYLPSALFIRLGNKFHENILWLTRLARLSNLITFIVLASISIGLMIGKKKWLLFVVALIPMEIYQASIVNPDAIVNGLALLFIALYIRCLDLSLKNKKMGWWMAISVSLVLIALCLSKPTYFILGLPIIFLPNKLFKNTRYAYLVKACFLALIIIFTVAWLRISSPLAGSISALGDHKLSSQINSAQQQLFVLHHPIAFITAVYKSWVLYSDFYLTSSIGLLGWNFVGIPLLATVFSYVVLTIVTFYASAESRFQKRQALLLLTTGIFCLFAVFGVLYLTFNPVGSNNIGGVQGRYFLPVLPFILFGFGRLLPIKVMASQKFMSPFFILSSTLLLIVSSIYYLATTY